MSELAGRDVIIKISGAGTSMTGEATTTVDNQSYQISNAAHRVIDWASALTVLDGGVETVEDYSINYLNGTITFDSVDGDRVITLTGKYRPMSVAAYAYSMSISRSVELHDVTPFGVTHKKRIAGLKSASGSLSQFDVIDATFNTALQAGEPVVLEYLPYSEAEPDRYLVLLESSELAAAIDNPQEESVSWVSKNEWIILGG